MSRFDDWRHAWPWRRPDPAAPPATSDAVPVGLDLLRADIYRILDALARARGDDHARLVRQFERAWEEFREATARRSRRAR